MGAAWSQGTPTQAYRSRCERYRVWQLGTALVFALRTVAYLAAGGGVLVPDTQSYSEGGSSWSSPLAAASGLAFGFYGVAALGVLSSLALGWHLGSAGVSVRSRCLLLLFPYGMHASADAAGAASAIHVLRERRRWVLAPLVALAHLQAALCVGFALLLRNKLSFGLSLTIAGALSMIGQGALGYFHSGQIRYFLIGLAGLAIFGARLHSKEQA